MGEPKDTWKVYVAETKWADGESRSLVVFECLCCHELRYLDIDTAPKPAPNELSKQVADALETGRLETAANEEYRRGRYRGRGNGGPALKALNAHRAKMRAQTQPKLK
jgi:hypothetical protein